MVGIGVVGAGVVGVGVVGVEAGAQAAITKDSAIKPLTTSHRILLLITLPPLIFHKSTTSNTLLGTSLSTRREMTFAAL